MWRWWWVFCAVYSYRVRIAEVFFWCRLASSVPPSFLQDFSSQLLYQWSFLLCCEVHLRHPTLKCRYCCPRRSRASEGQRSEALQLWWIAEDGRPGEGSPRLDWEPACRRNGRHCTCTGCLLDPKDTTFDSRRCIRRTPPTPVTTPARTTKQQKQTFLAWTLYSGVTKSPRQLIIRTSLVISCWEFSTSKLLLHLSLLNLLRSNQTPRYSRITCRPTFVCAYLKDTTRPTCNVA